MDERSGTQDEQMQSAHEERVAEFEETPGEMNAESDATVDEGRRPTSADDLAADRDEGYEDPASQIIR